MHELSIVLSVIDLVAGHCPAGATVERVYVEAGPLRGIDPEAMQFAWRCAIPETVCRQASLDLRILPWVLRCPACQRQFTAADPLERCCCGQAGAYPVGGNELRLTGFDLAETTIGAVEQSDARVSRTERTEAE